MRKFILLLGLCLSIILFVNTEVFAQGNLISAKETAKIMGNDNVVLVSTRKSSDYAKVHIKDAVNIDLTTLYKPGDIKGIIKSPEEISTELGAKGIDKDETIIIYDNGKGINAGRLYWILKYLGCKDVKILDGHMKAWRAAKKPVTKYPTKVKEVTFTPSPDKKILATYEYVKSNLNNPKVVIVDAQSKKEFDEGYIDGAINFEYKNIINEESGTLKSPEEITGLLKGAGITPDKEIILYCATSARTGILFMAMTSILDYPNVKVYDGAWNEWKTK